MKSQSKREKEIRAALRAVRKDMRDRGIRKSSCFNGGHTPESYRCNAELFRLTTLLAQERERS